MKQNNLSRHSGRRAGICREAEPIRHSGRRAGIYRIAGFEFSIGLMLDRFRVKPGMTDIVKPEMTEMNEIL